jgi:xanthine dehydrogenase accessory factor
LFEDILVLVKGAGDLATGVAYRLHRAGFPVVMTEIAEPTPVRRTVSFAEAVYEGETQVEGLRARLVAGPAAVRQAIAEGLIPVVVDPEARLVPELRPMVVVDAIIAKRNVGTSKLDAPIVIGLGPGFVAGEDVHAVVETNRGHYLGRVFLSGSAEPNTGVPGPVGGYTTERLLRAPVEGTFASVCSIGDQVEKGEVAARVDGEPVLAGVGGVLRGLVRDGLHVTKGMKIGDVDPRAARDHCFTISDKGLAIGGGVLEAVLFLLHRQDK